MKKYKKIRVYPKVYPKATAFAHREYVDPYELDGLNKGYYHGYVAGVKAMQRELVKWAFDKKRSKEFVDYILGKGKLI